MCSKPGSWPNMPGSDFDWSISTKPVVWLGGLHDCCQVLSGRLCHLPVVSARLGHYSPINTLHSLVPATAARGLPSLPCPAQHPELPSSLPAFLPHTPALPHLPHLPNSLPHPPVTSPPPLHLTSVRRAGLRGCVSWRLLSECRNVSRSRRCPQSGGEISARPAGVTLAHGWSV